MSKVESTAPVVKDGSSVSAPLPPAKRTGLIVVVAALLLLLVAGVAGAMLLVPAFRTGTAGSTGAKASKPAIEAAIGVMKALRVNDLGAVRPYLVDVAQKAITDAQWKEAAASSEVASSTFSPAVWSGETTATIEYTIDGGSGTMTFAPNPEKPGVVTMTESSVDGDVVYDVELVAVGAEWRVLSLTPAAEPFNLDVEFVKSLIEVPESDPTIETEP